MDNRGFTSLICLALLLPLCFMAASLKSLTASEHQITTAYLDDWEARATINSGIEAALQNLYDHPEYYAIDYHKAPLYGLGAYRRRLYSWQDGTDRCKVLMRFYNHGANRFKLAAVAYHGTAEKKTYLYLQKEGEKYAVISRNEYDE